MLEFGYPKFKGHVPYWLAYSVAAIFETIDTLRGGEPKGETGLTRFAVNYMMTDHYFCIDKAKKDLDWKPKVSLAEGIKLTVAALKEKGDGFNAA